MKTENSRFSPSSLLSFILIICANTGHAGDYSIVDTGQDKCYNATAEISAPQAGDSFYGQDAQFDGNQPAYTIGADGLTVYDQVTGLTWTQSPDWNGDGVINSDDEFFFPDFLAYVDDLNARNYGGYSDWRAPTIKELYSLIDFGGTDPPPAGSNTSGLTPFISTDYFDFAYGDMDSGERIIDAQYWSSTDYVSTTMDGFGTTFGVNFADGRIKGYGRTGYGGEQLVDQYARFVRGNTNYGINDFHDNGDGTITDMATGLMWAQDDNETGLNWEDALAWVQQMNNQNYLGYNDWRLPNAKELQSIVDYTRSPSTTGSAAIDPVFNTTAITNEADDKDYPFYWTGTTHIHGNGGGGSAVYVAFGRGLGSLDGINVIDVHGAGCQRSDPKEGDPADYPSWGHGPQGDVQRVFNYVRLVRDAGHNSDVNDKTGTKSSSFFLNQNYPNPFNPATHISYSLPSASNVELSVFNLRGQKVKILIREVQSAGTYNAVWDATDNNGLAVPSGIYICRLIAGNRQMVMKMNLVK